MRLDGLEDLRGAVSGSIRKALEWLKTNRVKRYARLNWRSMPKISQIWENLARLQARHKAEGRSEKQARHLAVLRVPVKRTLYDSAVLHLPFARL